MTSIHIQKDKIVKYRKPEHDNWGTEEPYVFTGRREETKGEEVGTYTNVPTRRDLRS